MKGIGIYIYCSIYVVVLWVKFFDICIVVVYIDRLCGWLFLFFLCIFRFLFDILSFMFDNFLSLVGVSWFVVKFDEYMCYLYMLLGGNLMLFCVG